MAMVNNPLVSICLITYNHALFIREAIEGVLLQKTSFVWELIIADDFSTDGTRDILIEYQSKYPDCIRLIFQESNVGPARNWKDLMAAPSGKYIAYFEGDDYWMDPGKLDKQVEFLEANQNYSICFHRVYDLIPGRQPEIHQGSNKEETYTIEDLAKGNFIITTSAVFRSRLNDKYPSWFYESPVGDYVLHMLNSRFGKIKYFPQPMAVYRHGSGIWSGQKKDENYKKLITVIDFLLLEFYEEEIRRNLILQKLNYLMWIEDWDSGFNPTLSKEEIGILLKSYKRDKENMELILKDAKKLAAKVPIKTLVNSIFKRLSFGITRFKK